MKIDIHDILKKPVVSEQSMAIMPEKKYTFIVDSRANKFQIKEAVEKLFQVSVERVTTANYTGKVKRVGVHIGKRPDYKKAIVKLTQDSKSIEFFEGMK